MITKTFFIDIDGTLLEHLEDFNDSITFKELKCLPGVPEKLVKWHCEGHKIILTTGRPESTRAITELQLHNAKIIYDKLIMGVGAGPRILINDYEEGKPRKAFSYNVLRNVEGLEYIDI